MGYLTAFLLIVCGLLAAASWIVSKKPNAKQSLDKLVPFQGFLGVGLLAVGIINLFRSLDGMKYWMKLGALYGLTMWSTIIISILLGFLLGMPQIAKWIPGDSPAEQKAIDMQRKLGAYSTIVGFIGIVCGVLVLLYLLEILKVKVPGVG
ncbi:MAG TPA: hypothetical protein VIG06_24615 [Kofleriaceae bacterium]|jgi:hypothetical protein